MGEQSLQTVTYTAQFDNLERVRTFVAAAAEACGLEPAAVYAVQLAVDEAFSNIIEHSYQGEDPASFIQCDCRISSTNLSITLRDCGRPFNPLEVPQPDFNTDLEGREVGGLGLYFIHQLMDHVSFAFGVDPETGQACNLLTMVKNKDS
jgi:serine/threonine-protein kinase RsbW